MNKRILAAAVILGLGVMACGFGGTRSTATPTIVSLPPTAMPPLVQPTQSSGSSPSGLPFSDDFSNPGNGWAIGDYGRGSVGYGNGYYFVKVTAKSTTMYGAAAPYGISDVELSVDAVQFNAPRDNNTAYGVGCRVQDDSSNDGYYFRIGGDGEFSVVMYNNGSFTSLLPGTDTWQASHSANQGNISNHIVVSCNGNHLTFTVNGKILFDGTDNTLSSGGLVLLGVVYDDNASAEFHFTNFQARLP